MIKQTAVMCECGSEVMTVEYYDSEKTFCFVQFKYTPVRHNFWRRIKFLFTGEIYYNEIFLSPESAKEIADYISKNI